MPAPLPDLGTMDPQTKALAQTLVGHLDKVEVNLNEVITKQNEEIAKHGGTSEATLKALNLHTADYEKTIKDLRELAVETERKNAERIDGLEAKMKRGGLFGSEKEFKSCGQSFVENEIYKAIDPMTFGGNSSKIRIESPWTSRKDISGFTGSAALRNVLSTQRLTGIQNDPIFRTDHVRDFMTVVKTNQNAVQWAKEVSYTDNAGAQANEGDLKPKSQIEFSEETANSKTYAAGIVVARQLLADVPGIQEYLDNRLEMSLLHKEDTQILFADGSSGQITGVWNTSGVPFFNRWVTGDTMIDQLRRTITQIRKVRYMPNLFVLSLEDWEAIELLKDNEDRYIWVQVQEGGTPRLWRTPVIDTDAMPEGKYLAGDFRNAATLYDREEYTVRIFDQHEDYALRNLLLLLAEGRIMLTVEKVKAFVKGNFGRNGS